MMRNRRGAPSPRPLNAELMNAVGGATTPGEVWWLQVPDLYGLPFSRNPGWHQSGTCAPKVVATWSTTLPSSKQYWSK
jgi:hypothetical protein